MYLSFYDVIVIFSFVIFLSVTTFSCYILLQSYLIRESNNSNLEFIGILFLTPTTIVTLLHLIGLVHVWFYFSIMILVILITLRKSKSYLIKIKKINKSEVILLFSIFLLSIFVYYFDAYNNISLNHPDAITNYYWAKTLVESKELIIQPGLSGLLYPLLNLFEIRYLLNYIGATLGIVSYFVILLMLNSILGRKGLLVFVLISLSFPLNVLTTVRFGLHSGVIFQVIILSYLIFFIKVLESKSYIDNFRTNALIFFLIFFQAGMFSASQTLTLLVLCLFLFSILGIYFRKSFYYSLLYFIMSFFGFLSTIFLLGPKSLTNSVVNISSTLPSNSIVKADIEEDNYLLTVINDFVLPVKQFRPLLESHYAIGSYLLVIPLVLISIQTFKRQNLKLLTFSLSCLFYIVVLNTGIFELTLAKGRSGWNLLLLVPITLILLIKNNLHVLPKNLFRYLIFVIFLTNILQPPRPHRPFPEEAFVLAKQISRYETHYIYSNIPHLEVVSRNLIVVDDLVKIISSRTNNIAILYTPNSETGLISKKENLFSLIFNQGVYKNNTSLSTRRGDKNLTIINHLKQNDFIIFQENIDFIILKRQKG